MKRHPFKPLTDPQLGALYAVIKTHIEDLPPVHGDTVRYLTAIRDIRYMRPFDADSGLDCSYTSFPECWRDFLLTSSGYFDFIAADVLQFLWRCRCLFYRGGKYRVNQRNTVKGYRATLGYISLRLGHSLRRVTDAVSRLKALGLVTARKGFWKKTPCLVFDVCAIALAKSSFSPVGRLQSNGDGNHDDAEDDEATTPESSGVVAESFAASSGVACPQKAQAQPDTSE